MKLAVLGGVVVLCAATAFVAAQQAPAEEMQTVFGCLKGEGTAQSPWVLAGVVIPPPAPVNAGRGGRGGPGGRGGGRQAGPPPAPTPPPPPPPPIDLHLTGLDMTPWRGYRVEVTGMMGAPATGMREFKAEKARSVYNTCEEK